MSSIVLKLNGRQAFGVSKADHMDMWWSLFESANTFAEVAAMENLAPNTVQIVPHNGRPLNVICVEPTITRVDRDDDDLPPGIRIKRNGQTYNLHNVSRIHADIRQNFHMIAYANLGIDCSIDQVLGFVGPFPRQVAHIILAFATFPIPNDRLLFMFKMVSKGTNFFHDTVFWNTHNRKFNNHSDWCRAIYDEQTSARFGVSRHDDAIQIPALIYSPFAYQTVHEIYTHRFPLSTDDREFKHKLGQLLQSPCHLLHNIKSLLHSNQSAAPIDYEIFRIIATLTACDITTHHIAHAIVDSQRFSFSTSAHLHINKTLFANRNRYFAYYTKHSKTLCVQCVGWMVKLCKFKLATVREKLNGLLRRLKQQRNWVWNNEASNRENQMIQEILAIARRTYYSRENKEGLPRPNRAIVQTDDNDEEFIVD